MGDVAAGGPGLLAAGWAICPPGEGQWTVWDPAPRGLRAVVWASDDGTSWESILLDTGVAGAENAAGAKAVAVGPDGIAVVGWVGDLGPAYGGRGTDHRYGAVWLSEDGKDWRLAAVLEHGPLEEHTSWYYTVTADAVLWQGDRLLVFGTVRQVPGGRPIHAIVWASSDLGQSWHLITMVATAQQTSPDPAPLFWTPLMSDATALGDRMVAVGGTLGRGIVWLGEWATG